MDQEDLTRLGTESLQLTPKVCCVLGSIVVIGFEQNVIIKYNLDDKSREILISSPFNAPRSLCSHPTRKVFAVVGLDKFIRFYAYDAIMQKNKNTLINCIELTTEAFSLDFSPDGKFLCLGYQNGAFEIF